MPHRLSPEPDFDDGDDVALPAGIRPTHDVPPQKPISFRPASRDEERRPTPPVQSPSKTQSRAVKPAANPSQKSSRRLVGVMGLIFVLCACVVIGQKTSLFPHLKDRSVAWLDGLLVARGFGIAEVTVSGAHEVSDDVVKQALGKLEGHSVLTFHVGRAKRRLEQQGWIAQADITRRLPQGLHVAIRERVPFAIWQNGGAVFLIDRTGAVLMTAPDGRFSALPLVTGRGANKTAAGIIDALAGYPQLRSQMRAWVRVGARRWDLQLENGVIVKLPAHNTSAAIMVLAGLEQRYGLFRRDILAIDLRVAGRPTLELSPDAALRRGFLIKKQSPETSRRGRI